MISSFLGDPLARILLRVAIHVLAMGLCGRYIGLDRQVGLPGTRGRLRAAVYGWFVFVPIVCSTLLYAGPWWFWGAVYTIDYGIVVAVAIAHLRAHRE